MCVIITAERGTTIPDAYLEAAIAHNPDGAGIAWLRQGKVAVRKGLWSADELLSHYRHATRTPTPVLVHCRIATGGQIDVANCHPFQVNPTLAFVHNGILPFNASATRCDTSKFVRDVIEPLASRMNTAAVDATIDAMAEASGSRFAALCGDGYLTRWGSGWVDLGQGLWASNNSCLPYDVAPATTPAPIGRCRDCGSREELDDYGYCVHCVASWEGDYE